MDALIEGSPLEPFNQLFYGQEKWPSPEKEGQMLSLVELPLLNFAAPL